MVADWLVAAIRRYEESITSKCPPSGIVPADEDFLISILQKEVGCPLLHVAKPRDVYCHAPTATCLEY